jgi:hypothetical protein
MTGLVKEGEGVQQNSQHWPTASLRFAQGHRASSGGGWKVTENILNKEYRTADRGLLSSLRVGRRPNNARFKKKTACYKNLGSGRIIWNESILLERLTQGR